MQFRQQKYVICAVFYMSARIARDVWVGEKWVTNVVFRILTILIQNVRCVVVSNAVDLKKKVRWNFTHFSAFKSFPISFVFFFLYGYGDARVHTKYVHGLHKQRLRTNNPKVNM